MDSVAPKTRGWLSGTSAVVVALLVLFAWLIGMGQPASLREQEFIAATRALLQDGQASDAIRAWDFSGSLWLGAFLLKIVPVDALPALRILVLAGGLIQWWLVSRMAENLLSRGWLLALLVLVMLCNAAYQPYTWAGLVGLFSVYALWMHLRQIYMGRRSWRWLVFSGVCAGLSFWFSQSLGIVLAVALSIFGVLHHFFHEREEKNLTFREVSNLEVLRRWLADWGPRWLLPILLIQGLILFFFNSAGLLDEVRQAQAHWLSGFRTESFGYFTTFQEEFTQLSSAELLDWRSLWRTLAQAALLILIGVLPIVGILGMGLQLPARFIYRLLKFEDEAMLLWWISAFAMILATFGRSSSLHIAGLGLPAFLMAALLLQGWVERRTRLRVLAPWMGLLLMGFLFGAFL